MNNRELLTILSRFGFKKVGEIRLIRKYPAFELGTVQPGKGFVYVWVEIAGFKRRIVYVGKAGRTVQERCKQHAGGFRNSTTGRSLAGKLRRSIKEGSRFEVHARKSPVGEVCEERDIPMAAIEELAFIQKFNPPWNTLKSTVTT